MHRWQRPAIHQAVGGQYDDGPNSLPRTVPSNWPSAEGTFGIIRSLGTFGYAERRRCRVFVLSAHKQSQAACLGPNLAQAHVKVLNVSLQTEAEVFRDGSRTARTGAAAQLENRVGGSRLRVDTRSLLRPVVPSNENSNGGGPVDTKTTGVGVINHHLGNDRKDTQEEEKEEEQGPYGGQHSMRRLGKRGVGSGTDNLARHASKTPLEQQQQQQQPQELMPHGSHGWHHQHEGLRNLQQHPQQHPHQHQLHHKSHSRQLLATQPHMTRTQLQPKNLPIQHLQPQQQSREQSRQAAPLQQRHHHRKQLQQQLHVTLVHARHCLSRALASAGSQGEVEALLEASLASSPRLPLLDPVCVSAAVCQMVRLRRAEASARGLFSETHLCFASTSAADVTDMFSHAYPGSGSGVQTRERWPHWPGETPRRVKVRGQAHGEVDYGQQEEIMQRNDGGVEMCSDAVVGSAVPQDAGAGRLSGSSTLAPICSDSAWDQELPALADASAAGHINRISIRSNSLEEDAMGLHQASAHRPGEGVVSGVDKLRAAQEIQSSLARVERSPAGIALAAGRAVALVTPPAAVPVHNSNAGGLTVAVAPLAAPLAVVASAAEPRLANVAGRSIPSAYTFSSFRTLHNVSSSRALIRNDTVTVVAAAGATDGYFSPRVGALGRRSQSLSAADSCAPMTESEQQGQSIPAAKMAERAVKSEANNESVVVSESTRRSKRFLRLVAAAIRQCLASPDNAPANEASRAAVVAGPSLAPVSPDQATFWAATAAHLKSQAYGSSIGAGSWICSSTLAFVEAAAAAEAAAASNPFPASATASVGRFRPRELANIVWGIACLRSPDAQLCGRREDQRLVLGLVEDLLPQPLQQTTRPLQQRRPCSEGGDNGGKRGQQTHVVAGEQRECLGGRRSGKTPGATESASPPGRLQGHLGRDKRTPNNTGAAADSHSDTGHDNTCSLGHSDTKAGSSVSRSRSRAWFQSKWRPGELAMLGWGMARAGVAPPSRRWLLSYISAWDQRALAAAGASDLGCLAWSLARWQCMAARTTAWRRAVVSDSSADSSSRRRHRNGNLGSVLQVQPAQHWLRLSVSKARALQAQAPLPPTRLLLPPAWLEAFWSASAEQLITATRAITASSRDARREGLDASRAVAYTHGVTWGMQHVQSQPHVWRGSESRDTSNGATALSGRVHWTASELAMLLWSLGEMGLTPPAHWLETALRAAAALAPAAPPLALATTLRGAALIGTSMPVVRPQIQSVRSTAESPRRGSGGVAQEPSATAGGVTATAPPAKASLATAHCAIEAADPVASSFMKGELLTGHCSDAGQTSFVESHGSGVVNGTRSNDTGVAASCVFLPEMKGGARRTGILDTEAVEVALEAPPSRPQLQPSQPQPQRQSSPSPSQSPSDTPLRLRPQRPRLAPCQSLIAAFARPYLCRCAAAVGGFGPSQVVDLMAAIEDLSSAGHLPAPEALPLSMGDLLDAAAARLQRCYSLGLGPRHMLAAASSLAAVGHIPPRDWLDWWLDEMYSSFIMGRLRGHELAALLRALATFRVVPGPVWSSALLSAAGRQLRFTDRAGLTQMVEAMAAAGLRLGANGNGAATDSSDGQASSGTAVPAATETDAEAGRTWAWLARFLRVWTGLQGAYRVRYYGALSPLLRPPTPHQAERLCTALVTLAGPVGAWPSGPRTALRAALMRVPELRRTAQAPGPQRHAPIRTRPANGANRTNVGSSGTRGGDDGSGWQLGTTGHWRNTSKRIGDSSSSNSNRSSSSRLGDIGSFGSVGVLVGTGRSGQNRLPGHKQRGHPIPGSRGAAVMKDPARSHSPALKGLSAVKAVGRELGLIVIDGW